MVSMKLYIIGNGFDLYHKIPSSFQNFKNFVFNSNQELFDTVERYLPISNNWSDLESSLADIDVDEIIESALEFLAPYNSEDWSDAYHHDYRNEIVNIVSMLSRVLLEQFRFWLLTLEIPHKDERCISPIVLDRNAKFLSFNYTNTLEKIYLINDENVIHIHGKIEDEYSDIVLGHSWLPSEIRPLNDDLDVNNIDARIVEGNNILDEYFQYTFKPVDEIIEKHNLFFESLEEVNEVYVLGHSLSQVDFEYFEKVQQSVSQEAQWYVSYYNEGENIRHEFALLKLGVTKEKIHLFHLSDGVPQLNKRLKGTVNAWRVQSL
ncbi:TPA: bacteriophage abortive infection AbiH family protein [Vibrio cholerae]|nr:bacteriophage abortive infection AbiH family protein [Vibrio cholerae]HBC3996811.1 bacteriophage abortive infection AbiH family protein [Vibrio cholerae]HDZ9256274.1 bacteriophage abortive infection AbiH family protein [Vibrio cholerae]